MPHPRGLIIGAGILGTALAYELSRRGTTDILVVDPDLEGIFSSTERNAGGVRHLWPDPLHIELSRKSIQLFNSLAHKIGFHASGYLWLQNEKTLNESKHVVARLVQLGLPYQFLDPRELLTRYAFLDKNQDIAGAILGTADGILNSNALKLELRALASAQGTRFQDATLVDRLDPQETSVSVRLRTFPSVAATRAMIQHQTDGNWFEDHLLPTTKSETIHPQFVVIATGAWTAPFLHHWHKPLPLRPIRRQIAVFKAQDFSLPPGMFVDTSGVYFHREGGNILAGRVIPSEREGFYFDMDESFFEEHIWLPLSERSTSFERLKLVTGWGGLYSYTPDGHGVLGVVPPTTNVFECHSFTGSGVMKCYGAACALADLILDGEMKPPFGEASVQLSRMRFSNHVDSPLSKTTAIPSWHI